MFNDNRSNRRMFHPAKIFFFVGIAALFIVALGGVVMFLWNAILPDLVGVRPIKFWGAIGLLLLSKILFGRFHFGPNGKKFGPPNRRRRQYWKEKWMNMSEEERAAFKEKWRRKC